VRVLEIRHSSRSRQGCTPPSHNRIYPAGTCHDHIMVMLQLRPWYFGAGSLHDSTAHSLH